MLIDGPEGFARTAVMKRVLPQLASNREFVAMFLAEARLSARLHHPNIVQIYDCGELDGTYFLVMEHIDGLNLARLLSR
ncbi:MAG: protein kinase, partial [Polyangia bacterium]